MKKLLVCMVMGLALSSAYAAPAAKDAAPKSKAATSASKAVAGVWVSTDASAVTSPGTMTLSSNGDITLAPDGFEPLQGTYKVQGQFIDITTARGKATLIHKIAKDTMTVEYENGAIQNFTKQTAGVPATSAKKKEVK